MRLGDEYYNYRIIAEGMKSTGITEVLYLQGPNFLEAAKNRSVLGLKETQLRNATIYRSPVGNSTDRILIGTIKDQKITYESQVDKIEKGLEYLTWNSPILPDAKEKPAKVEVRQETTPTPSGKYEAESYTIDMKIEE